MTAMQDVPSEIVQVQTYKKACWFRFESHALARAIVQFLDDPNHESAKPYCMFLTVLASRQAWKDKSGPHHRTDNAARLATDEDTQIGIDSIESTKWPGYQDMHAEMLEMANNGLKESDEDDYRVS